MDEADELLGMLREAIEPVRAWQETYGSVGAHPSVAVDPALVSSSPGRARGQARGQLPLPPPPLCRADAQAAAPRGRGRLHGDHADQPQQPRPRRRPCDGSHGEGGRRRPRHDVRLRRSPRSPHLLRHHANLEALFVARELHPDQRGRLPGEAHYTHARMCHALGVEGYAVPADATGRMDLDALDHTLRGGRVGTVVATLGTTGLGAVDPVHGDRPAGPGARVPRARRCGLRRLLHAVADDSAAAIASAPFDAYAHADSVVVDPHKHGLQPYGCGAVLLRDPAVGRHYPHDSPYTYFTSDELHLGEITLECSRAGAAAVALWATLQVLPLTADGTRRRAAPGVRAPPAGGRGCSTRDRRAGDLPGASARHRVLPPAVRRR